MQAFLVSQHVLLDATMYYMLEVLKKTMKKVT